MLHLASETHVSQPEAMRLVIERLVPSNAPEEELRAAADGLEEQQRE